MMRNQIMVAQLVNVLGNGGIERNVASVSQGMGGNFRFDFIIQYDEESALRARIQNQGGSVLCLCKRRRNRFFDYLCKIVKFFHLMRVYKYDIVHIHASYHYMHLYAWIAHIAGVKKIIVQSHTSDFSIQTSRLRKALSFILRRFLQYPRSINIAVSKEAGNWLFGNVKYTVVRNGIEFRKYEYCEDTRRSVRKELNLEDSLIFGHVGRFNKTKNHSFIIQVFLEVEKQYNNAKLILIGDGECKDEIIKLIDLYGIKEKVMLLGTREDVGELMQAMDVFIFPSLYEGLGIALIEAQAASLLVFASDNVTHETKISNNIHYLPLCLGALVWANIILGELPYERYCCCNQLLAEAYSLEQQIATLKIVYNT